MELGVVQVILARRPIRVGTPSTFAVVVVVAGVQLVLRQLVDQLLAALVATQLRLMDTLQQQAVREQFTGQ